MNVVRSAVLILVVCTVSNFAHADLQTAVDSMKMETEKDSSNFKLYFDLGLCYSALEEYSEALQAYRKALELNEAYRLTAYRIADLYLVMDSTDAALEVYENLIKAHVSEENRTTWIRGLYYRAGKTYALRHEPDKAIRCHEELIKLYKNPYQSEIILAMLYKQKGDSIAAEMWMKKAIEHIGELQITKDTKAIYRAIYCYYMGKYKNAISIQDSVVGRNRIWTGVYNSGSFKIAAGDSIGLGGVREAIELDTTGFVDAVYHALISLQSDSFGAACEYLTQDIPNLSESGIAQGLRAWTLEQMGREDEARRIWLRCYSKLPLGTNIEAMRNFISEFVATIKRTPGI
jgi:tetratricopeptide (TPR) repeat protein